MTAPETRALPTRPADLPQLVDALSAIAAELAGSAQALHHIAYYLAAQTAAETTAAVPSARPEEPVRTVLSKLLRHGPELLVGIVVTIIAVMISAYLFGESFR
jgi:hypothetical protein